MRAALEYWPEQGWARGEVELVAGLVAVGQEPAHLLGTPLSVQNPLTPQVHAIFYGTATVTDEGAEQHVDKLAKRFLGVDKYPYRAPGEKRLIVRTRVDRIGGFGL